MKAICLLTAFLIGSLLSGQVNIVYPGDTNNDSIVNVRDLLPVGIAFGAEVIPRADMDINWAPKPAQAIPGQELPVSGVNYAYINANGDFLIDSLDIDAIALNYDSMVVPLTQLPPSWSPDRVAEADFCPTLRLSFNKNTVSGRDTILAGIFLDFLPDIIVPPDLGILGLSFSMRMNYDPTFINDTQTRVLPNTGPGDLMFVSATSRRAEAFRALPPGRIDLAAAGRGENSITQSRFLGQVSIIVEDIIIRSTDPLPFTLEIDPASVLILNNREEFFKFCLAPADTVFILTGSRHLASPDPPFATPNPSRGEVRIQLPYPALRASLLDLRGQTLWKKETPHLDDFSLILPGVNTGLYLLVIHTSQGLFRQRMMLMR